MALTQTQGYKDFQNESKIYTVADRVIKIKNALATAKSEIAAVYAVVDADANADADLKTLATQANAFMTNAKVTDFISFVASGLE